MNHLDCQVLGLTMCIVGVVAFANSIVYRRPRQVIEEFFGASRPSLRSIKDHVLRKVHTYYGLGFLIAGFLFQILGWLPAVAHGDRPTPLLPIFIVGVIVVSAGFEIGAARYSRSSFRRHLRKFFRAHPEYPLERNLEVAKEIGEVFDLKAQPEETVEGYLARVRQAIGIEAPGRRL